MTSPEFEVFIGGDLNSIHTVTVPKTIVQTFLDAGQKRVKVQASFEGKSISFHAALQKKGEMHVIMFSKNNQKALGIFPNDYFTFQLFKDDTKYGVEVPEEFDAVIMSDYDAFQIFENLTPGKKRGIIYMIARYKNSQTRIDKSLVLCENLKKGVREAKDLLKPF